jgi:hypothetical protein
MVVGLNESIGSATAEIACLTSTILPLGSFPSLACLYLLALLTTSTLMTVLPTEIYELIFAYACMDGGSAGSSLSLVSRQMAAISRPWRYQSVMLIGSSTILLFSEIVARHSQRNGKIPIRHLYIADHTDDEMPYFDVQRANSADVWRRSRYWLERTGIAHPPGKLSSRIGQLSHIYLRLFTRMDYIKCVNAAVVDVLTACAPTLWTLTINIYVPPLFKLVPMPLPVLDSLAIITAWSPMANHRFNKTPQSLELHPMPRLQQLDVLCIESIPWLPNLIDILPIVAPSLVDVRLGADAVLNTSTSLIQHFKSLPLPESIERVELYHSYVGSEETAISERQDDSIFYIIRKSSWYSNYFDMCRRPRGTSRRWLRSISTDR